MASFSAKNFSENNCILFFGSAIPDNKEPRRAGQGMWGVAGGIIAVILATAAVVIVVLVWR